MVRIKLLGNRRLYVVLGIALILVGAVWKVKAQDPRARFLASYEDIDINSGEVMHTRYLCWLRVSKDVEETWLSRAADRRGPAAWRRVHSDIFGAFHTHCHVFGMATTQIRYLEGLDGWVKFDRSAKKQIGNQALLLWQQETTRDVNEYIAQLFDVVKCLDDEGITELAVADLSGVAVAPHASLTNNSIPD